MSLLPPEKIKEMAAEIAKGNTCYIHRFTTKVTTIDNTTDDAKLIAKQEKQIEEIERKMKDHVKVVSLTKNDEMTVMREFLDEISDRSVHKQLSHALNRKNPYRNFTTAVESDMELFQHWRNFKALGYERWVSNILIDAYNY